MNYYDQVLLSIPAVSLSSIGLLSVSGVPTSSAVCLGFLPILLIIGHALFVRTPHTPRDHRESQDAHPIPREDLTDFSQRNP